MKSRILTYTTAVESYATYISYSIMFDDTHVTYRNGCPHLDTQQHRANAVADQWSNGLVSGHLPANGLSTWPSETECNTNTLAMETCASPFAFFDTNTHTHTRKLTAERVARVSTYKCQAVASDA